MKTLKSYPFQVLIIKLSKDARVELDKMSLEHDHQVVLRVQYCLQLLVEDLEL